MPRENTVYPIDKMAAKKAAVLGAKKTPPRLPWLLGLGLAALIAAGAVPFLGSKNQSTPAAGKLFTFTPEASESARPTSDAAVAKENPR